MIRPVFANTAFVHTRARFVLRGGSGPARLRVRCGLIEHPRHGPVLIDAGYGPRVTERAGRGWALRAYAALLRPQLNPLESPLSLLADHGYLPEDVKLVLLTHLHADHVAYLRDLPDARFLTAATSGTLRHGVFKELLPDDFAARCVDIMSFPRAELPFGIGQGWDVLQDGSVLAVPLPGHADEHFGLCFSGATPLMYATDVQWVRAALEEGCAPGFPASLIAHDPARLAESTALVRRFAEAGGDVALCHDPVFGAYDWTPSNV